MPFENRGRPMTDCGTEHPLSPKFPAAIVALCLIAGCASNRVRTTPATLIESEGPSVGSLVTMTVDVDRAIPPVGATCTLRVLARADDTALEGIPIFGNLPLTNVTIGLAVGTVEVVEVSGRTLAVRIAEPGVSVDGEPVDMLNERGNELELECISRRTDRFKPVYGSVVQAAEFLGLRLNRSAVSFT